MWHPWDGTSESNDVGTECLGWGRGEREQIRSGAVQLLLSWRILDFRYYKSSCISPYSASQINDSDSSDSVGAYLFEILHSIWSQTHPKYYKGHSNLWVGAQMSHYTLLHHFLSEFLSLSISCLSKFLLPSHSPWQVLQNKEGRSIPEGLLHPKSTQSGACAVQNAVAMLSLHP